MQLSGSGRWNPTLALFQARMLWPQFAASTPRRPKKEKDLSGFVMNTRMNTWLCSPDIHPWCCCCCGTHWTLFGRACPDLLSSSSGNMKFKVPITAVPLEADHLLSSVDQTIDLYLLVIILITPRNNKLKHHFKIHQLWVKNLTVISMMRIDQVKDRPNIVMVKTGLLSSKIVC